MPVPHPTEPERERVFLQLLLGTFGLTFGVFILLIVSSIQFGFAFGRLLVCVIGFVTLSAMYWLWRRAKYRFAAYLLVLFYGTLATLILAVWGINTPFGELLMAVTIVLASILLGPKHSLYAAGAATLVLFILQLLIEIRVYQPHFSDTLRPTIFGDVIGYGFIFGILALVSWLFGKNMEQSLKKARAAEAALLKEKELLEVRVAERTLELEALQFQEMQQLYRFAEMGQLSAALLHDLANQLTVLTLDIEDLRQRAPRSEALSRARNSVKHLEHMIDRVRRQLQGQNQQRRFALTARIKDTLHLLNQKTHGKHVSLEFEAPDKQSFTLKGDSTRFSQALAILVTNSIDAYEKTKNSTPRIVKIRLTQDESNYIISVADWGVGISKSHRPRLFQPFYSTKETGMGIGLFIAKEIVEKHFGGALTLDDSVEHTEFIITLPKHSGRK